VIDHRSVDIGIVAGGDAVQKTGHVAHVVRTPDVREDDRGVGVASANLNHLPLVNRIGQPSFPRDMQGDREPALIRRRHLRLRQHVENRDVALRFPLHEVQVGLVADQAVARHAVDDCFGRVRRRDQSHAETAPVVGDPAAIVRRAFEIGVKGRLPKGIHGKRLIRQQGGGPRQHLLVGEQAAKLSVHAFF